jgi:hypothetical protein
MFKKYISYADIFATYYETSKDASLGEMLEKVCKELVCEENMNERDVLKNTVLILQTMLKDGCCVECNRD